MRWNGAVSNASPPTRVLDAAYRRGIHRFPPSALLPLIAEAAVIHGRERQGWMQSPYKKYTPWALADAARVSILLGTEHRTARPTKDDLLRILDDYSQLSGSFNRTGDFESDLLHFLLRMSGEQLVWQEQPFRDLARSAAMLLYTASAKPLQSLVTGWDEALFGCSLLDYVGIAQLVWATILNAGHKGWFHIDHLPDLNQRAVAAGAEPGEARFISRATMERVIREHFTASVDELRAEDVRVIGKIRGLPDYDPQLRRFEYNPLRWRPLVSGLREPGWLLCPSVDLVMAKATPWGICQTGRERLGLKFTPDVGHLFEQYVGRQLRLLPDAAVHGEIRYRSADGRNCEGADWIVVFDDLVLVVEVKSMIPTQPIRMGGDAALEEIVSKLAKAHAQIDTTAELISDRHEAFAAIPAGLPIHGMVVTLQPFYIGNFSGHRRLFPDVKTSMSIVSASEIEALVTLEVPSVSRFLLDLAADTERSTWQLTSVIEGMSMGDNPILDESWESYPWFKWP